MVAAFSLFTLYNDSIQRTVIRNTLENHLEEMSKTTANNVQAWLSGRVLLVNSIAEFVANNSSSESVQRLLELQTLLSTFTSTYLGGLDGSS